MPIFLIIFLLIILLALITILRKKEKEKIEFFHLMAHKLRSPISIIKWYTELLTDKSVGTLNDRQKEYFNEIYKASEKLNEIIDSFLKTKMK